MSEINLNGQITLFKVKNGQDGAPGAPGKTAYQLWLEAGNAGTESDFLASLNGQNGAPGTPAFKAIITYEPQEGINNTSSLLPGQSISLLCRLYAGKDDITNEGVTYEWYNKNEPNKLLGTGKKYTLTLPNSLVDFTLVCKCYIDLEECAFDEFSLSEIIETVVYETELVGTPSRFKVATAPENSTDWVYQYEISPEQLPFHIYRIFGNSREEITQQIYIGNSKNTAREGLTYQEKYYSFSLKDWHKNNIGNEVNETNDNLLPVQFYLYLNEEDANPIGSFSFINAEEGKRLDVSLTASKWQALIDKTSMVFNTTGLTLYNGAFKIASATINDGQISSPTDLFYYDTANTSLYIKTDYARIGNWCIGGQETVDGKTYDYSNALYNQTKTIWLSPTGISTEINSTTAPMVFKAGSNFGVDISGNLYASNAKITGEINATSLKIVTNTTSGTTSRGLKVSDLSDGGTLATVTDLGETNDAVATAQSKANQAHSLARDAALGVGEAKDDAAEAATKATNYLRFDDGVGLIVGNLLEKDASGKTSLTYNICIDSDSLDIRYNNNIISSFNEEGFSLLNGAATLYCTDIGDDAGGYRGILTIQSDSLSLISSDIITLWPSGGRGLIDLKGTVNNQIVISVGNGKKMVYGKCTDQTDGTSFVGGLFENSDTSYSYTQGLAIGGSTGNLLWKNKIVATTDMIPSIPTSLKNPYSLIVKGNSTQSFVYDGSAGKTLNIKAGDNVTINSNTSGDITISNSGVRSISTGSTNGTISVDTGGSSAEVAIKNCAVLGNGTNGIRKVVNPGISLETSSVHLGGTIGDMSRFYSNIGLVIINLVGILTGSMTANQYYKIGTVPSGYRPGQPIALSIYCRDNSSTQFLMGRIRSGGEIEVKINESITANHYIIINGAYIAAGFIG